MAKDKRIEFVATETELHRFRVAATELGLSLSAWMRMVALKATKASDTQAMVGDRK